MQSFKLIDIECTAEEENTKPNTFKVEKIVVSYIYKYYSLKVFFWFFLLVWKKWTY